MRSAIAAIISTAPTGYSPTAVSWESITASVPSRIALATSATSARVGREEDDHRVEHLRGGDRGAGERAGQRDHLLLHDRHLLDAQLDAEVAARDHHAVGGAHDLLRALHGLRLLDLGDQRQPRVAADELDVLGAAHERQRDQVDADRLADAPGARGPPAARRAARRPRRGC